MESKLVTAGSRIPPQGRWLASLALLALAALLPAEARDPLQADTGLASADTSLLRQEIEICQLLCGRELAQCERERRRGVRCPRDYQFCKDDCSALQQPRLTAAQRQERLCTQRCETSSALCEQETTVNDAGCRAGLSQCVARC